MWLDFILASIHHVLVFSLFAIITMELMMAKPGINAAGIGRLARVDGLYGLFSMLILIVGFSRAIWGLKGWDYYAGNYMFWAKVGANKAAKADPANLPSDEEVRANRKWLHMETTVLIIIPVIAAALARGIGDG
jgi:putative membrane protein